MSHEKPLSHTLPASIPRKLAAILHADVKGYSRLMGADEVGTLRMLTAYRSLMEACIAQHSGRIVGTAGDGFLVEFASVVDAVQCAVDIQTVLTAENAQFPSDKRMEFRIGINLGDVMVDGEQIYGDGVNIAARLESLADAGGICISGTVHEHVRNKLALTYEDLGEQMVKNIAEPVRVYRVRWEKAENQKAEEAARQKSKGKSQKAKIRSRVRPAHQIIAGLVLIAAVIAAVRYIPFSSFRIPHSEIRIEEAQPPLPLPDKPSIAVLPFVNMSNDPEQEYFSDGITEDITSDLSKISSLFVIARNSAFTYKGKAVNVQDAGRELGVRYVLEGSVRKADDQVRITAQLIDASTGGHLWSERYDRQLKDIFALQDDIRQKIVTALKVKLTKEEQTRFKNAPTNNLEAYDYFLRGMEHYWRFTKDSHGQARQMFERATELDPMYAAAYAESGWTYATSWFAQWSQGSQALDKAIELVQKALVLDESSSSAHMLLGWTYLFRKQHERAIAELQRTVALDPNLAVAYARLGFILNFAGRPQEARGVIEKSLRLDPTYPFFALSASGQAYRLLGRYEEAIMAFKRALSLNPNFWPAHVQLTVCYSELGQEEAARAQAAEVLRVSPNFSLEVMRQRNPTADPAEAERVISALRKAGLK